MGFKTVDSEAVKNDGEGRLYKPPLSGSDLVYICPPRSDHPTNLPYYELYLHWNVFDGPVPCLKSKKVPCPICVANEQLFSMKNNADAKALSSKVYAKNSFYFNVIPNVDIVDGKISFNGKKNEKPVVKSWSTSKALHDMIKKIFAYNQNITDPTKGLILSVERIGEPGKDVKSARIQPMATGKCGPLDAQLLALLDNMPDLTKVNEWVGSEQMQAQMDVVMAVFRQQQARGNPPVQAVTVAASPAVATPEAAPSAPVVPPANSVTGLSSFEEMLKTGAVK